MIHLTIPTIIFIISNFTPPIQINFYEAITTISNRSFLVVIIVAIRKGPTLIPPGTINNTAVGLINRKISATELLRTSKEAPFMCNVRYTSHQHNYFGTVPVLLSTHINKTPRNKSIPDLGRARRSFLAFR